MGRAGPDVRGSRYQLGSRQRGRCRTGTVRRLAVPRCAAAATPTTSPGGKRPPKRPATRPGVGQTPTRPLPSADLTGYRPSPEDSGQDLGGGGRLPSGLRLLLTGSRRTRRDCQLTGGPCAVRVAPYDGFRDQEHPFRQPSRRAAVRAAGAGCAGRCAGHARSCSGHGCGGAGGCRSRDGDGRGGRCAPRGRGMRAHRWRIGSSRSCRCRLRGCRYGVGVHASGAGQRGAGRSRGPCRDDGGPGLCR